jgi:hypothetical protein
MPILRVEGRGLWVVGLELEKEELEAIKDDGEIDEDRLEEIEDDSEGYGLGFYSDSSVYVDDILLGTVSEILKDAKSDNIKKALKSKKRKEPFRNGWVSVRQLSGVFFCEEISDLEGGAKLKNDEKIKSAIIDNISVENDITFSLSDWAAEDNSDTTDTSTDTYFLLNGKRFEV